METVIGLEPLLQPKAWVNFKNKIEFDFDSGFVCLRLATISGLVGAIRFIDIYDQTKVEHDYLVKVKIAIIMNRLVEDGFLEGGVVGDLRRYPLAVYDLNLRNMYYIYVKSPYTYEELNNHMANKYGETYKYFMPVTFDYPVEPLEYLDAPTLQDLIQIDLES